MRAQIACACALVLALVSSPTVDADNAGVLNVLRQAQPTDVNMHPYPYLVIKNALPEALYKRLSNEFPSERTILGGKKSTPNGRYDIPAIRSLRSPGKVLTPLWTQFVKYHVSYAFWREVLRVFGPAIREVRPDLAKEMQKAHQRSLEEAKLAVRYSEVKDSDLRLDCQVGMNTPMVKASPLGVRGPHHDKLVEIFAGLLYLRQEDDRSTGASLGVYKCVKGKYECKEVPENMKAKLGMSTRPNHEQYRRDDLAVVNSVPYTRNTFVMFINTNHSIHGVAPRSASPLPRRLVNFIGEQIKPKDLSRAKKLNTDLRFSGFAGLQLNDEYL